MDTVNRLIEVINEALRIYRSEATSYLKYKLIFSNEISGVVFKFSDLKEYGYYDPDTSYNEDVTAFIDAASQLRDDLLLISR